MSISVVGSLHLDVVVHASHLPAVDETVPGNEVRYVFGGKGGNQAVAAARLGAQVAFCGRVGRDTFGNLLREGLTAWDIDVSQLQTDDDASGMSVAIVDDNGDYGAVIVSAANLRIDPNRVTLPVSTRILLLQNEVPEAVNIAAARQARALGASVWLNAAPARSLSPTLLGLLDLMIVNRIEAEFYEDLKQGPPLLATRGADGVELQSIVFPALSVDVLSTHGAGDMFVGALAHQVADGSTIEAAIPFAQAAAAWYISTPSEQRDRLRGPELIERIGGQVRR